MRGDERQHTTEHGAIMAANLLSSPRAIEVSVYVVRAFVRMREVAATHGDLARLLAELEDKTQALAMSHDSFSRNTRNQLKQVFDALRELMTPPDPPKLSAAVRKRAFSAALGCQLSGKVLPAVK